VGDGGPIDRESAVLRALRSLSERDQELLLLVAWDGLEREQASIVLGVTRGAFAVRLHRARRRFARALAVEDRLCEALASESTAMEV
jgi:DNA-directed RNA polymerase specialized sigma24 family protein